MKEIGGYFELEQLVKKEYYPELIALNSARYALCYLIRARRLKKIYLPYLLCGSVVDICVREGCEVVRYEIGRDFLPCIDSIEDDAVLYLVNYYGQLDDSAIADICGSFGRVIVDNVQAFFRHPVKGVDTIYSCRKFFGVPDGAYLSTDAILQEELPTESAIGRTEHLIGRFEGGAASAYYAAFKANDASFVHSGLRKMSKLAHNLLGAIDYEAAGTLREKNYKVLAEAFDRMNPLHPHAPVGPFAYPLYLDNGAEIKKKLALKHIYVPTLWPDEQVKESESAYRMAQNILPLPCDQRYREKDMLTIINEVNQCIV